MKNILVIEDDDQVRENIAEILELEDFEATTAENGFIGVQLAIEKLPDLIICDVMMPELDGYGVLKALRQNPATAAIPFIFLTAKAERHDLRQGMNLGADDYLTKPFTPDELRQVIAIRLAKQAAIAADYQQQLQQLTAGLDHLTRYDRITGLPNQLYLHERFYQSQPRTQQQSALLVLSLDQFHWLRSTLGHGFSEVLLKAVVERLKTFCNDSDRPIDTLAYVNTDQFILLLTTDEETLQVAQLLKKLFAEPFVLNGREVFITVSIGIASDRTHRRDLDLLIANAEIAMHHIKRQGGNGYQLYTDQMKINAAQRLTLESALHHAIENEQLQLYYQPQVDLSSGEIVGAEALLRWQHPEWGFVSPGKFIPIAEETGLIIPLGEWVLQTACTQAKTWLHQNGLQKVSVNLSTRQFNQTNLTQKLVKLLTETGLEPSCLELEVTETMLMQDKQSALIILNHLRKIGVQISIDDFGTGYSSLSYLQHFPFDRLKIDQSFVRNIVSNKNNMAIITAVISMAHDLKLQVTGEGVETTEELAFLQQQNCDVIQGYLFSKPIPPAEFGILLSSGKQLRISEFNDL